MNENSMTGLQISRLKEISKAIDLWLNPGNRDLQQAILKTVEKDLFSLNDIKHRILSLKNSLTFNGLKEWAIRSEFNPDAAKQRKILCLNAGNLPLVGIQDLIAVLMTGGDYYGKLSKKDPYLIPTFINTLQRFGFRNKMEVSAQLESFASLEGDAVLFSGSKKSVPIVREKLKDLKIADKNTPSLIRTAHFSVAWIHDSEPQTFEALTEAVFRYGGNGCRSVAIVVAPFSLHSNVCTFTDYVESFWLYNPQKKKPPASLKHRFALNKTVGTHQSWLDDFLIEESLEYPEENYILYWVQGGKPELMDIAQKYQSGLQSIYSTGTAVGMPVGNGFVEHLGHAQTPPIWWKPDGIDTIRWIQSEVV